MLLEVLLLRIGVPDNSRLALVTQAFSLRRIEDTHREVSHTKLPQVEEI